MIKPVVFGRFEVPTESNISLTVRIIKLDAPQKKGV